MALAFDKRRENHAIGQFDASLFFFKGASAPIFARAVHALELYAQKNDLPVPLNRQVLQFDLANQTATQSAPAQSAGWQRFASTGEVETVVTVDEAAVHFTCRNYTTWNEMLPRIVGFFEDVGTPFLAEIPALTKFQINYQNQFRNTGTSSPLGAEIFRESSGWIAPNVMLFSDAWHSNSGAFEEVSGNHRRLVNVNCSCKKQKEEGLENSSTYVDANILVAECYDIPDESPLVFSTDKFGEILEYNFNRAHTREKDVLRELLDDNYLGIIGA